MTACELRGAPVANTVCDELRPRIASLAHQGIYPRLSIVRMGENPGNLAYERGTRSRMDKLGLAYSVVTCREDCSQDELESCVARAVNEEDHPAVLVMRPLPAHLTESSVIEQVPPQQDVDGMTALSAARQFRGFGEGFAPCTAEAIIRMLDFYHVAIDGARVAVLGRSLVVGRPVAQLLQRRNATVTLCHSHTRNLAEICRASDIIVSCMGRAHTVQADMVAPGAFVIDVATNDDGAGGITGDVAYEEVCEVAAGVTPVPRGVGSVTTSVLAEHVVVSAALTHHVHV